MSQHPTVAAQPRTRTSRTDALWIERLVNIHVGLFRLARIVVWPLLDLGIRIWLAQIFFVSGVLKMTNWHTALDLAATEYPVSWMNPVTAAYTGAAIEAICPVFLTVGLLTRYAALPMLILSLVIQFSYQHFDSQIFWASLFGWYVVHGAGPLSLDRVLRRGLEDSAIPLAARIVRASAWFRVRIGPVYLSGMRIWLATSLLFIGVGAFARGGGDIPARWLPLETVAHNPGQLALYAGVCMLVGVGTRCVAIGLIVLTVVGAMMDVRLGNEIYLLMTLAILTVHGPGPISADSVVGSWLKRRFPALDGKPAFAVDGLPRVVIVGAGFGGLSCATALRRARVSVTLVDRANYHLFQPLLYQVATAGISPGDIAAAVRPLFRESFNTRVLLGTVTDVETDRQVVRLGTKELPYDYLVLATGAAHSYFGKDLWQPFAPGLKSIEDATKVRRRLLTAFEQAEATDDAEERRSLLTFLIVGGGPTGVELAGAIAELARFCMEKEFRRFDPASARVILVQSAPRVLPTFDAKLAAIAHRSLEKLGVEVLVGSRVDHIDAEGVSVSGRRIEARTVLWAAGVTASPAAKWLKADADNAGRAKVGADLSVPGLPNVYVIGDTALSNAWNGQPVPSRKAGVDDCIHVCGFCGASGAGGNLGRTAARAKMRISSCIAGFMESSSEESRGRQRVPTQFLVTVSLIRLTLSGCHWGEMVAQMIRQSQLKFPISLRKNIDRGLSFFQAISGVFNCVRCKGFRVRISAPRPLLQRLMSSRRNLTTRGGTAAPKRLGLAFTRRTFGAGACAMKSRWASVSLPRRTSIVRSRGERRVREICLIADHQWQH